MERSVEIGWIHDIPKSVPITSTINSNEQAQNDTNSPLGTTPFSHPTNLPFLHPRPRPLSPKKEKERRNPFAPRKLTDSNDKSKPKPPKTSAPDRRDGG